MSKTKAGVIALIVTLAGVPAAGAAEKKPKTVPGKEIASALRSELPKTMGVKARKATCPKSIKNKKGQTAKCKLTFVSGDVVGVKITLTDTNGGFKPKLLDMLMRHLEGQLEGTIKDFKARVVCPEGRTVKKADTFTCDIYKERSLVGFYDLTQVGDGRVRYAAPRSATTESTPANPVPADL